MFVNDCKKLWTSRFTKHRRTRFIALGIP